MIPSVGQHHLHKLDNTTKPQQQILNKTNPTKGYHKWMTHKNAKATRVKLTHKLRFRLSNVDKVLLR
jgi:hypothetical protein